MTTVTMPMHSTQTIINFIHPGNLFISGDGPIFFHQKTK